MKNLNVHFNANGMFKELSKRLEAINDERVKDGHFRLPKAEIKLLGQMSLLLNKKISSILSLAQTGDVDALIDMDSGEF